MIFFLSVYFFIYGTFHVYVFWKLRAAYTVPASFVIPWFLLMVLAPILARIFERNGLDSTARMTAWIGYCWFGLIFLFLSVGLVLDLWNRLGSPRVSPKHQFVVTLCAALLVFGYGLFEARRIRVERVVVQTDRLPERLKGFRIVQVSDLHLGHIEGISRLRDVIRLIQYEKPDLLVATGDIVDAMIPRPEPLVKAWQELQPRAGKLAVTGNHEFYSGLKHATRFLKQSGFELLRGERFIVDDFLEVAGVDDPAGRFTGSGSKESEQGLFSASNSRFRLLLKHQPRLAKDRDIVADLQLSGHTHRGQIFPFRLIVALFFPRQAGAYDLPGGGQMYVSRGTGTWGPPIRVLSPPEITVFDLVRPDEHLLTSTR